MQRSILLDEHRSAEADFATVNGEPLLLTYGDVPAEYRAATEGAVVFDQTNRGRVRVIGGDRAMFLHRLLANSVRTLEPCQGNPNLLLTPKGKVAHAFDLAVEPDAIVLGTAPGDAPGLTAALDVYLFTEAVELVDESDESAPLALGGPAAGQVLAAVLSEADAAAAAELESHATLRVRWSGADLVLTALPVAGSPGFRLDAGPERAAALWRALREAGAEAAGRIVWDSLRVEAGAAEFGVDVDDNIYPQEARWEPAFSLEKGCYIGQEVVAKIDTYGGLNKRLVALAVTHDDPVPAGTRLLREKDGEWRDLGVTTSWAYSFVLDTGLVLGYVKRKHQDVGTVFRLDDSDATARVVALPVRTGTVTAPE